MIDITKKYRTRSGLDVRLYAIDGSEDFPVHGAYLTTGGWQAVTWTACGISGLGAHPGVPVGDDRDLVEVKPRIKRTRWVNIHGNGFEYYFPTREAADRFEGEGRIACVRIEIDCEEGEGL